MISSFSIQNLCGPLYKSGNIIFHTKQNVLYSPVGNKIKQIDLENNKTSIFSIESRSDIEKLSISPDGKLMVAVDKEGYGLIINVPAQTIISHFNFKNPLQDMKFSPDGKFFSICTGLTFKIYEAPALFQNFEKMTLFKKFKGKHSDTITSIVWSPDSRFLVTMSKDLTVQMTCVFHLEQYIPFIFATHKQPVKQAFFSQNMKYFYTIDKFSVLCIWNWVDDYLTENYKNYKEYQQFKKNKKIKLNNEEHAVVNTDLYSEFEKNIEKGKFILAKKEKFFLTTFSKLKCAEYTDKMLVLGYANCHFMMKRIDKDQITDIQSFQLSNQKINSMSINHTNAWIAFGIKNNGQLMVWEWRSQSYILNQQCLAHDIYCCAFSKDGSIIATGGFDGKVRIWDQKSFLCISTLEEHDSKISGIEFTSRANTIVTCSLDGTVKCIDSIKYKCFRKLKPDFPTQFTALAVDTAGEIVCAGGIDPYDIYLWNIQTGNLLDVISSHQGPISTLQFSQIENVLFSGSWDKTLRIHDIFSRNKNADTLDHNSEITALAVRNDGKECSVATLKGEIYIWDSKNAQVIGNLECKKDIQGGRLETEKFSAKKSQNNKFFTSLQYSSDGEFLIAGGNSKFICLYELKHRILLKKFVISQNQSLDGILQKLNSKNIKDGMNSKEFVDFSDSDFEERKDNSLPGSKSFDISKRRMKLRVETRQIKFSPSEDSFIVATSEGLFIFSQKDYNIFTPYELDENVTVQSIKDCIEEKNYSKALNLTLIIDDEKIIKQVYENIPKNQIQNCAQCIPLNRLDQLLKFIASEVEKNNLIELHFEWLDRLLFLFNQQLNQKDIQYIGTLKNLIKQINVRMNENLKVADQNIYQLDFILNNLQILQKKQL